MILIIAYIVIFLEKSNLSQLTDEDTAQLLTRAKLVKEQLAEKKRLPLARYYPISEL